MYETPYRYGPIAADGRVYSPVLQRMVKLTPAMRHVVEILDRDGYVDKIDGISVNTIVALMDRGILREAAPLGWGTMGCVHFPATTPAQVEHEAYDENDRRDGELAAHVECPEQWYATVNEFSGAETHIRLSRSGYPIEIEQAGHRFWYVRINGRTPMSAGGTWQEARAAADRYERNEAHAEAQTLAMPVVHAFGRDLFAAASAAACGEPGTVRGPADLVTCPACRELLAQRAQTPAEAEAAIAALTQDPHEYPAPYAMGPTSRAAQRNQ